MLLSNSTGKNQFTFGPLRFNESHISLLSTAQRGQLTSILRAKKSDRRRYDSSEGYRLHWVSQEECVSGISYRVNISISFETISRSIKRKLRNETIAFLNLLISVNYISKYIIWFVLCVFYILSKRTHIRIHKYKYCQWY